MSKVIDVSSLTKEYKILTKEEGIKGSLKSFGRKKYEKKIAVNDISFSVDEGECVGFVGPNGAGKTTTIKMLAGIVHPTSGKISVLGYEPKTLNNEFKRNISVTMGQKNQLWWDIPAKDSFNLIKVIYDIPKKKFEASVDELTEVLDVRSLLNTPLRNLSLGERMKMEIIGSLLYDPKILFLDEPTIGLDVISRKKIREFFQYINKERKTTIMLTSHYLEDIECICNRVIAINKGVIAYDGLISDIKTEQVDYKRVSVCAFEEVALKELARFGTNVSIENNKLQMQVNKSKLSELGKALFSDDKYFDVCMEEVPLDESFEMLFSKEGK